MSRSPQTAPARPEAEAGAVAAVRAGDETAFADLAEIYRPELQAHCYRMLGSFEDSEDLVQETFLRAWRRRESFEGRSTFRAWLYRIATNACLDAIDRRPRVQPRPMAQPLAEVPWLTPYPDELLEAIPSGEREPEAEVVARETIELAFIAAIQFLPPKQRAVLILRDVLGWTAAESASLLDLSVAATNSALQRARATLQRQLPRQRLEWGGGAEVSDEERALLDRYMEAVDQNDPDAMIPLLREDAVCSMPPQPEWHAGREAIIAAWVEGGFGTETIGDFRCVAVNANRQPAMACYLRRPGDDAYRPLALDVLRIEDGRVAEVVVFGPDSFASFGLPATM
jgi:RNA polymerase sigma-70 factor (ECF subfamily)